VISVNGSKKCRKNRVTKLCRINFPESDFDCNAVFFKYSKDVCYKGLCLNDYDECLKRKTTTTTVLQETTTPLPTTWQNLPCTCHIM